MGYLPPVNDAQTLIYGHRQNKEEQMIYATPAAEKIEFLNTSSKFSANLKKKDENEVRFASMENLKAVENEVTGKGSYIDISI